MKKIIFTKYPQKKIIFTKNNKSKSIKLKKPSIPYSKARYTA